MALRVRSLFLKIFLWFWATVIATAVALVATWIIFQPGNVPSQSQTTLADSAWVSGTSAVDALERRGATAAAAYMEEVRRKTHLKTCLFDTSGNVISGADCAAFADIVPHAITSDAPTFNANHGLTHVAVKIQGESGRLYIYGVEANEHRGPPPGIRLPGMALRWSVALLVSGFICYLLTRYLTAPILRLREASQRLAAGDLGTRAAADMERRHDELGSLVRDFNSMATRIEELVSRQRQLIYDVSHELRSPLARLNVALDLARERKGADPAFAHMEQDIERMNEMIGRLLTVARLDTSTTSVPMKQVDLSELVSNIVGSARFELQGRNDAVQLTTSGQYFVQGNAELLHSAIENVMRNAIRYTTSDSSIEVGLRPQVSGNRPFISLTIRDYGRGVPESELLNIFQPFFRVEDDRARQSGGAGLGLAIAERVVRIHGGTIHARNVAPHGLQLEMLLPQLPLRQADSARM